MLRFRPIANAKAAEAYYGKSDGSYYLDAADLHREWGGDGAKLLELDGPPQFQHFSNLLRGNDPHNGEQLTARLAENRLCGWDITASVPKGVTVALEFGDRRVQQAIWEANREAMEHLATYAMTRVRKNGVYEDRQSSNLIWFSVEHPETRPAKEDNLPDPDRHIHNVLLNVTYDAHEAKWKAVKFRPIMDQRMYFDRWFDQALKHKLTDLGYRIDIKYKAFPKVGMKYHSWDIEGVPKSVTEKFSRRTQEVEELADALGVASAIGKDKLGATSRRFKRTDLTLEDFRAIWRGKLTDHERQALATLIHSTHLAGPLPSRAPTEEVAYSLDHHFDRHSVKEWEDLAVTAMQRSKGDAPPQAFYPEAVNQGVLRGTTQNLCTTEPVLDQETKLIALARAGRGKLRAIAKPIKKTGLSHEQEAAINHVLTSPDQFGMVLGLAGVGKTTVQRVAADLMEHQGLHVTALAQSADASRRVLADAGFKDATTIAAFLDSKELQEKARNQVIFLDEGSLVGTKTMLSIFETANRLNARLVVWGDERQHGSIERGAVLTMLQDHLPVPKLTEIRRQKGDYKKAVEHIAKGDILAGYDILDRLGWVRQTDSHTPLVDDYMAGIATGKHSLVVCPTHVEGDAITAEIRDRLKQAGIVSKDEHQVEILKTIGWTAAEKADKQSYTGEEIVQFVRNTGSYKAGQRVKSRELLDSPQAIRAANIAVYTPDHLGLAGGDVIRATGNGWDVTGKHRINNGSEYTVKAVRKEGIALTNGWTLPRDFAHLSHGYVSTSYASQGKTVNQVLIAMGSESRPAVNQEQFYVSASRGRESLRIYSSMAPEELRHAIQRQSPRMTATELMKRPVRKRKLSQVINRVHASYRMLRERVESVIGSKRKEPVYDYGISR